MKTKQKLKSIASVLSILLLLTSSSLRSQNDSKGLLGNNELKINAFTPFIGYFEMSYERILNDKSSIGVAGGFIFEDTLIMDDFNFIVIPNYRFFFGKKPAAGFFLEGNLAIFSQEEQKAGFIFGSTSANNGKSHMGLGLGLAIGSKFVLMKSGIVAEIFAGGGPNFLNLDLIDDGFLRFGISIGKRF